MTGQKSRLGNILIGVVIGLTLSSSLPVAAGDVETPERGSALTRRVARLERKVSGLRADTGTLESKESQLATSGAYLGKIDGDQINIPLLCNGQPATWSTFSIDGLDC